MTSAREAPRVFVTRSLAGLGVGPEAPNVLDPLAAATRCRVWPGVGPPTRSQLLEEVRGCEGLLCLLTDVIDAALLSACPELRVVSSMSVGLDHVDLAAASARGIPVGHTPGVLTETTADLCFALLLAAARRIPEADRFVREGRWTPERRWEPDLLLGTDVHGAVLGVVGLGAIGTAVARRGLGFGMRVLGWSRHPRALPGVERASLDDLLARADFVSIHVALAPETRGLVDAERIARLKPGAFVVNTARGGILDEEALAAALHAGRLAGAALDVFEQEPLPAGSPLLGAPNLVLTPHVGSASRATRRRMGALAVENLLAGLEGRPMPHCANAAALASAP